MAHIYDMTCEITIGKVKTTIVSAVKIESTIKSLSDTATVMMPRNINEFNSTKSLLECIEIDNHIEVKLGYNGKNFTEFEGYVKNIGSSEPIELECEDEMYMLRKKEVSPKHYTKTMIKTLIKEVVNRYDIVMDYDFELIDYRIPSGKTAYDVLYHLKENYPIDFYFIGKILHGGYAYSLQPSEYKTYHLEQNVSKNDLKYIVSTARKARVKATSTLRDGKTIHEEWGDKDASIRTLNYANIESKAELLKLAKAEVEKMKFTGYEGKITGFGHPRTQAGKGLKIESDLYSDRDGKYLIDGVAISFDESGYRRECEISKKISV